MAMPASVLAVDQPMSSIESLKLSLNRLETVAPAGLALSAFTAASMAEPLATGASLTGVTRISTVSVSVSKM